MKVLGKGEARRRIAMARNIRSTHENKAEAVNVDMKIIALLLFASNVVDRSNNIWGNEKFNQSFDCSFNVGVLMKYYTVRWFVGDVDRTTNGKKMRREKLLSINEQLWA